MGSDVSSQVSFGGLVIDGLTEAQVVVHVIAELRAGRGGRLVTLNVDIFRAASRDPDLKQLISESSLLVPDGMPVVWAARLRGTPVAERVTGASLILSLSAAAAQVGRSVYLLGGAPGVPERAGATLRHRYPALAVAGAEAPPLGFDATPSGIDALRERLVAAAPDIVYVGLGFPKQERLIARIAPALPSSWFVGCGAAITFAAGVIPRAPRWMQQAGLEWLFRLAREPRRLGRRYLIDDVGFAALLLASCAGQRATRRNGAPAREASAALGTTRDHAPRRARAQRTGQLALGASSRRRRKRSSHDLEVNLDRARRHWAVP
jgi:N-acetylglucosaminyldiphosphoundecaprenol N-acetyl-beta-D-mannosaminyltransferase